LVMVVEASLTDGSSSSSSNGSSSSSSSEMKMVGDDRKGDGREDGREGKGHVYGQ